MEEVATTEIPSLFGRSGISLTNYITKFGLLIPVLLLAVMFSLAFGLIFLARNPGKRFLIIYSYVSVILPIIFIGLSLFDMMKTLVSWDQGALGRLAAYSIPFYTVFASTFISALIGITIFILLSFICLFLWLKHIKETEQIDSPKPLPPSAPEAG